MKTTDILLRSLPPPCEAHSNALTKLVEEVYRQHGMDAEERYQRLDVVDFVADYVKEKLSGKLYLYLNNYHYNFLEILRDCYD